MAAFDANNSIYLSDRKGSENRQQKESEGRVKRSRRNADLMQNLTIEEALRKQKRPAFYPHSPSPKCLLKTLRRTLFLDAILMRHAYRL